MTGKELQKKDKRPLTIKEMILSAGGKKQFQNALPKHLSADRFVRVALTTLNKNPKLMSCSQASLFS